MSTAPGEFPVRVRTVARVLLVDDDQRVLLLHDHDPRIPELHRFWITPGGGIDPGETPEVAAAREVWEETGLRLEPEDLGPMVLRRRVRHRFGTLGVTGVLVDQQEDFFLVRVPAYDPVPGALTEGEVSSLLGWRWWDVADLAATPDDVWPRGLAELLPRLLGGEQLTLPDADEHPRAPSA